MNAHIFRNSFFARKHLGKAVSEGHNVYKATNVYVDKYTIEEHKVIIIAQHSALYLLTGYEFKAVTAYSNGDDKWREMMLRFLPAWARADTVQVIA